MRAVKRAVQGATLLIVACGVLYFLRSQAPAPQRAPAQSSASLPPPKHVRGLPEYSQIKPASHSLRSEASNFRREVERLLALEKTDDADALIDSWVMESPETCFSWLVSTLRDTQFTRRHLIFFEAVIRLHPERLREYLRRADEIAAARDPFESMAGARLQFTFGNVAVELAKRQEGAPPDALLKLPQQVSGQESQRIEYALASTWSRSGDPVAAVQWLDNSPGDRTARAAAFHFALDYWARADAENAAQWASAAIERDALSNDAIAAVMFRWSQMDPVAATSWLAATKKMSEPAWIDAAVASAATGMAREFPERAVQWIHTIGSESIRDKTLRNMQKWSWDNKEGWDQALLSYLEQAIASGTSISDLSPWIDSIHDKSQIATTGQE